MAHAQALAQKYRCQQFRLTVPNQDQLRQENQWLADRNVYFQTFAHFALYQEILGKIKLLLSTVIIKTYNHDANSN